MIKLRPGDSIQRLVTIKRVRKGIPTVIMVEGRLYTLMHEDTHPAKKPRDKVERE